MLRSILMICAAVTMSQRRKYTKKFMSILRQHLLRFAQIAEVKDVLDDIQNTGSDDNDSRNNKGRRTAEDQVDDLSDDDQHIDRKNDLEEVIALFDHVIITELFGKILDTLNDVDGNT